MSVTTGPGSPAQDSDDSSAGAGAGGTGGEGPAPAGLLPPAPARPAADAPPGQRPRGRRPWGIGAKVAALVGALLVVLVASSAVLLAEVNRTAAQYDRLIAGDVRLAQDARTAQVEFKKQVQEWKNVLLRGTNPDDLATYTKQFRAQYALVQDLSGKLVAASPDAGLRQRFEQFRTGHEDLQRKYENALTRFSATDGVDFRSADRALRGQDRPLTDQLDGLVATLEADTSAQVAAQKAAVADRQTALTVAGLIGVLIMLGLLFVVVRRIVGPIQRLTREAYAAASVRLPEAVTQIKTMPMDGEPPHVPAFRVHTGDELADLADAMTTMQASALDLALEQHRRDRETAQMLLNLGRRNQMLLARVLKYVTDLERVEQDPDVVAELFRIDHATTRIRRNAASMLVLAGAPPAPARPRAVRATDVLRAALSEIEDYVRVDLHHIEEGAVVGSCAADLTHLLAELLENATNFSPPNTRVTVVGQRMNDGYRIRVIDQGIGMTRAELDDANVRISGAGAQRSDARLLGLHVVGLLAARLGAHVSLEASAGLGITATVQVPRSVLSDEVESELPAAASGKLVRTTPGEARRESAGRVIDLTHTPPRVVEQPAVQQEPEDRVPAIPPAAQPVPERAAVPAAASPLPVRSRDVRGPHHGGASEAMLVDVTQRTRPRARVEQLPAQPVEFTTAAPPLDRAPAPSAPVTATAPSARPDGQPAGRVPTRVRGTHLAKLGIIEDDGGVGFVPPAEDSSNQLRRLQLDVEAARRRVAESERTHRSPARPAAAAGPATPGPEPASPGPSPTKPEPTKPEPTKPEPKPEPATPPPGDASPNSGSTPAEGDA